MGYSFGKNEAWYFLEADTQASIVYGYRPKRLEEAKQLAQERRWEDLLDYKDVHQEDFVYIPAGTLHALRAGSIVYEVQQATDVTFRLYDYGRRDAAGNQRELHTEQALMCLLDQTCREVKETKPTSLRNGAITITTFIKNDSFCIMRIDVQGAGEICAKGYLLASVIQGSGKTDDFVVAKGDHFFIPAGTTVQLEGCFSMMITCE